MGAVRERCAAAIAAGTLLNDPLDLRPLPLSGIPGWHADNADEAFHRTPRATSRAGPGATTRRSRRHSPPPTLMTASGNNADHRPRMA